MYVYYDFDVLQVVSLYAYGYNGNMRINRLHGWDVNVHEALEIQHKMASKVLQHNNISNPRLIAGLDVSVNREDEATAVAVVLNYPPLELLETSIVRGRVRFPYIPGLLSFREVPLTIAACEKLKIDPDLVMVDGQGIAHPRRMGLASHLGLFLNKPTIGCAKSPLYGQYQSPSGEKGNYRYITDNRGETIGAVLRTKTDVKPLFISPGHKIDLSSSIHWVLQCCREYRLPEPTRQAHLASKGVL
jgi:deoxyribonuclease V